MNSKRTIKERVSLYFCPILLGASICYSIIYSLYEPMALTYTVVFLLCEVGLYALFDKLKEHKVRGGIIYTVMLAVSVSVSVRLVAAGMRRERDLMAPIMWFFGAEGVKEDQPFFLGAVFIGGGFFMISVLYYFTQIHYRTLGVILCILFPFVIYSRRSEAMNELMVTVIVSLYIAVVVHNRELDPSRPDKSRIMSKLDRSYLVSIAVFVSITGMITMMVEKPEYLSLLERSLREFGDYNADEGRSAYGSISQDSGRRYGARNYSGSVLFYFETSGKNSAYYLRRQPYTTFNGDIWHSYFQSMYGSEDFKNSDSHYKTDDILRDFAVVLEESGTETKISPESCISIESGRVYSDDFTAYFLPVPLGWVSEPHPSRSIRYTELPGGTVLRSISPYSDTEGLDDSFTFCDQPKRLYDFASSLGLSAEKYIAMLSNSESEESLRLLNDYALAYKYYTDTYGITARMSNLANTITKDCKSDYEKAKALSDYFELNGYIYDEDYIPDDTSIDYFIFEGKRGVCTSYATAMTLLARSVGLPARYTEGFAAFEKNSDDVFVIRDQYAHAFVEVYIPGTGWLTFDPTVSGYMAIPEEDDGPAFAFGELFSRSFVVIAVGIMILLMLLRDRLAELAFRLMQLVRDPRRKVLKLYENVIRLVGFSEKRDCRSYTVSRLRVHLAETRGRVPEKLLCLFEKTAFGGYSPTKSDYREAYKEYKRCYGVLRKLPKKKRPF